MGLNLLTSSRPDADTRAAIDGEMTIYTVAVLKDEIERVLGGRGVLEIDLSAVSELDSAGLQLMLMAKRLPGKSVRFTAHSPAVLRMLELSNLARAIGDPLLLTSRDSAPA